MADSPLPRATPAATSRPRDASGGSGGSRRNGRGEPFGESHLVGGGGGGGSGSGGSGGGGFRGRRVNTCSFCGKTSREVGPMVEGPNDVYICSNCTELCQNIFRQTKKRGGAR